MPCVTLAAGLDLSAFNKIQHMWSTCRVTSAAQQATRRFTVLCRSQKVLYFEWTLKVCV